MTVDTEALSPKAIEAYLGAVDWLIEILDHGDVTAAWAEPTCVASYTVGGVAAHAVHGVLWLEQVLRDTEPTGLRKVTVGEFFGPNRVEGVRDDDSFSAALRSAAEALRWSEERWWSPRALARLLAGLLGETPAERAIPVLRVPGGQVPLHDYLRTRVLEVVVHGDDVTCSIPDIQVPEPPAQSTAVCLEVCLELARCRVGSLGVLRALTRAERSQPDALRVR
jgi:hypothetical protein